MKAGSRRWVRTAVLSLMLAGCGPLVSRPPAAALHDLGGARAALQRIPGLRSIEVRSASWLDGSAMHYRLAYESATRRDVYAFSRWAASPPEMLTVALRQMLQTDDAGTSPGCRLRIDIDEFIQHYVRPDSVQALLSGRAALTDMRGQRVLASMPFAISEPAIGADAAAGVAASARAVDALGVRIAEWITSTTMNGTRDGC
ncbi:PqiC family protein [Methyloversatilis sp. XJ19-49]|uniref:ABC-type transport auxiliary lipoprotein family protein n=1 Tax=Methyloversatilis sp. XJ19-49 TaxID=2963429 RepID=UPI00211B7444|nr:PqiC family protein [Methyloversatilis sp. XJ19-49]MCQ9376584.1 PqiC family protein [Methyloversatilis sp. XJ19-49]